MHYYMFFQLKCQAHFERKERNITVFYCRKKRLGVFSATKERFRVTLIKKYGFEGSCSRKKKIAELFLEQESNI
jgi:hypothetical protein